jgi:hypothetical protein
MADKPEKAEKAEKKDAKGAGEKKSTPHTAARNEKKKSRWTEAVCVKYAKRFQTREEWAAGAPSSYKAAVSHGWEKVCCAHMSSKPAPKATPVKKSAPAAKPLKRSA